MHQIVITHPPVSRELIAVMDESSKDHFLSKLDWQTKNYTDKYVYLKKLLEDRRQQQLPMCQIWYYGDLVGIAWPSMMTDEQTCKACGVEPNTYFRVGKIFILPEYRSTGLGTQAVKAIIAHYKHVVMLCRDYNNISNRVAERAELNNIGILRGYKRDGVVVPIFEDVHNPEESVFVYNIWKN